MATVTELVKLPAARVADEIKAGLIARGSVSAEIDKLPVSVDQWRKLARQVARDLGRPVRTMVLQDWTVNAILMDWPLSEDEEQIQRQNMRAMFEAASLNPGPTGLRLVTD